MFNVSRVVKKNEKSPTSYCCREYSLVSLLTSVGSSCYIRNGESRPRPIHNEQLTNSSRWMNTGSESSACHVVRDAGTKDYDMHAEVNVYIILIFCYAKLQLFYRVTA